MDRKDDGSGLEVTELTEGAAPQRLVFNFMMY